ncbi:hypothetical protein HPB48_021952 [Haemaphysalis longicornis]|uniref:Uncharacterized protein n=1 Tax=Haemaphysalis longicornis TaxID=44386 RepID=A0A9J6FZF1_HAELO|nr:hypothetical protein HPB48_021952 [Haemaphysalis longicornis]
MLLKKDESNAGIRDMNCRRSLSTRDICQGCSEQRQVPPRPRRRAGKKGSGIRAGLLVRRRSGCQGVTIRRLSVPRWVRNGTDTPVVLDCEYVYNENDLKLVVKWFFNDGLEPVYQWIPEMKVREAFGVLQGRLDETYSVNSRDDYSQYRAIRILRPTKELSGSTPALWHRWLARTPGTRT